MKCKICEQEFKSLRSLHCHLKKHNVAVSKYYMKYAPKYDPFDGSIIPYKTQRQFELQNFNSFDNFSKWIESFEDKDPRVISYIQEKFTEYVEVKKIKYAPDELYLRLSLLPLKKHIEQHIGNYKDFCESIGLTPRLHGTLPSGFWIKPIPDIEIAIDTREQKPLPFKNSKKLKLDFGDYTTTGKYYSKTFVERKSAPDFASTITQGINRFEKEVERCKRFNSYLFVVVESSVDMFEHHISQHGPNAGYIWHCTRNFLRKHPDSVQIVFSVNRNGSKSLIPKILYYGDQLWDVDLQKYCNERLELCRGNRENKHLV